MVDAVRSFAGLALGALAVVAALMMAAGLMAGTSATQTHLFLAQAEGADGDPQPMSLHALDAPAPVAIPGVWDDSTAVVLSLDAAALEAAAAENGMNTGAYAIAHPSDPERALVAYRASSPVIGCVVHLVHGTDSLLSGQDHDGDGIRDGLLVDPCHPEGQWDPYRLAASVGPGDHVMPGLDIVRISLDDGRFIVQGTVAHEDAVAFASQAEGFRLAG